ITQKVSSRLSTRPLPALLAACSRLIRWRSTRICLSSVDRLSMASAKASFISGRASTAGRMSSSTRTRSGFLAHPGKEASLRLRAKRTRLDITIRSYGPLRRAESAGGVRNVCKSMALNRRGLGQPSRRSVDFIPKDCRLFEILVGDGLGQLLLEQLE